MRLKHPKHRIATQFELHGKLIEEGESFEVESPLAQVLLASGFELDEPQATLRIPELKATLQVVKAPKAKE